MTLKTSSVLALFLTTMAGIASAQTWAPGIVIDGNVDEWDGQVPAAIIDGSGDGGTGRDIKAVYLANDATNLYVRVQSFNSNGFDGNELAGINGDGAAATGFALFGGSRTCDTLIGGASAYALTSGWTNGAANPATINWAENAAQTDVEFAVPLNMQVAGSIGNSFPALGSPIGFVFGDSNGGAGDAEGMDYTLATAASPAPVTDIDLFDLYDTNANAAARTKDLSVTAGFSTTRANRAAGGPGGASDVALQVTHTNAAAAGFAASLVGHRFATPINISGHTRIEIAIFGDATLNAANQNFFIGLVDQDGSFWAVGAGAPTTAAWTTYDLGPTSGWFEQAAGSTAGLDLTKIVEYRLGIQENGNAVGSTSTIGYDNFRAVNAAGIADWQILN